MVDDILDYIEAYENVRAICGFNKQELPDATLALSVYRNKLSIVLLSISGIYTPVTEDQDLQQIFDRLATTDKMYAVIQQLAIYTVADAVLDSVGLRAYKTLTDGKSNLTRFSPESAYTGVRQAVKENISQLLAAIGVLFVQSEDALEYLSLVIPNIDLVVGGS